MRLTKIIYVLGLLLIALGVQAQQSKRTIDEVVAVVDTNLITRLELENRLARIEKQFKASNKTLPPESERRQLVLERLISEKIQLNLAKEAGIKVSDKELERIIENIAAQNKLDKGAFKEKIEKEGTSFIRYKEDLRGEVLMSRIREKEVDAKINVSESEIDAFISEKNRGRAGAVNDEIYLAQILVATPQGISEAEMTSLRAKADEIYKQAASEKDFLVYAKKIAVTGSGMRSEDLGYRTLDRLPQIFTDAVDGVGSNQMVPRLIQSPAGFHILKVVDRRGLAGSKASIVVTQTLARHILLRHRPSMTDAEAQRRLSGFRDQIKVKAADFSQLAKKYSEDGSAANGGDLGWMSPGELVPPFEQAMNQLSIGEVSEPVRTEFGWHLIQVIERRQAQLSSDKQREFARAAIRERKLDQAYDDWLRQIRDAATVVIRQTD